MGCGPYTDYVLGVEGKYLRNARRYIRMSGQILEVVPGTGRGPFQEVGRKPGWMSFPLELIFVQDANDANDVTLPTFRCGSFPMAA
jgi:hypothetical protein